MARCPRSLVWEENGFMPICSSLRRGADDFHERRTDGRDGRDCRRRHVAGFVSSPRMPRRRGLGDTRAVASRRFASIPRLRRGKSYVARVSLHAGTRDLRASAALQNAHASDGRGYVDVFVSVHAKCIGARQQLLRTRPGIHMKVVFLKVQGKES